MAVAGASPVHSLVEIGLCAASEPSLGDAGGDEERSEHYGGGAGHRGPRHGQHGPR